MFLLAHMLDQCAPSRAFSIVATINTSCGQLMISPRGDDDMVAQVWSWSEYLSTYFTKAISFCQLFVYLSEESHNVKKKQH